MDVALISKKSPVKSRPLSPHLGIYRLPLTAVLSISHRITGALLVAVLIAIAALLWMATSGSDLFLSLRTFLDTRLGMLTLWASVYALFFHFCHGLRHLIWDFGHGFERRRQNLFNVLEILGSFLLTALTYAGTALITRGST